VAAASGDVVHLAGPVTRPTALLAHELHHLREPVTRPRFRLAAPTGTLDLEERGARAVETSLAGHALAGTGITGGNRPTSPVSANMVSRLPVGPTSLPRRSGPAGTGPSAETVNARALSAAAFTHVAPMHTSVADPPGWLPPQGALVASPTAGVPAGGTLADTTSQGSATPSSIQPDGVTSALAAPAASVAAAVAATSTMVTRSAPLSEDVVDDLVDALERRVLAELERRGGRYSEAF
jgi:hypothetical protein